jgi:hypothetical protein
VSCDVGLHKLLVGVSVDMAQVGFRSTVELVGDNRQQVTEDEGGRAHMIPSADAPKGFRIPYPRTMFLMFVSTVLNMTFAIIASGGQENQLCAGPPTIPTFACLTPYSFFVIWTTVSILLAMVNDVEPDIVLMFATIMLTVLPGPCTGDQTGIDYQCTIITPDEGFQGFRSPPILAAATLLVFARCLEETRVVEKMIVPCLNLAFNDVSAVACLAFPTFFASSFLNSTPIVAMLIPVVESWSA